jgi:hypothetical protein
MALGIVSLNDVVVPEIFNPYMQNITEQKTRIIQSGAAVMDAAISAALAGAGMTFKTPSFKDLDDELEDIMTDDEDDVYNTTDGGANLPDTYGVPYAGTRVNSNPRKIGSLTEICVRLSRHMSWSSLQLAATLAGKDPLAAITNRVAYFWARRRQAAFVACVIGILADNAAAPTGTEHVINDLTFDASLGGVFQQGVTEFTTANFLRTALTMGDSQEDLGMVVMHSVVFHKAQLNNLIEFVPDAINNNAVDIPFFLGRRVIVDDGMPVDVTGKIFETWLFGAGAFRMGVGSPNHATELERAPRAGNGAGQDILHTRVEWCLHPVGYQFTPTAQGGGPSNAATAGNLAHLDSWKRVFPERKQIKIARLRTIELP